ncbi:sensor histidine kinase [Pseudofulvimonas gallinarii]|uniref:Histidine kinase/DNA gyrase B/HSP90-like ATPase n=1 Tax=Pseudofulvimonas gallinarii TaxID=634155 RepID=A0A4R3LEX3_9GAMM|nr:ATP-binding protein [Pseudofulvimonas gallinarii]TCS98559.1 histidine kinase/DNA gyrase B/HSP90-like ATPase [Pseudofulvimonas gallinarii]
MSALPWSIAALSLLALPVFAAGMSRRLRQQSARLHQELAAQRAQLAAQAVAAERERIHADLHDDLGARLLELIYAAPDRATADRARAILQDLRDVVSRSRGEPGTLQDVLASIRSEAAQRLAAAGAGLSWEEEEALPDPMLDPASSLHLHRIVREAISNALRHAGARSLRIRVRASTAGELLLELTDDGCGGGDVPPSGGGGAGLDNMRARARELQGQIDWTAGTLGGTKVLLKAPLPGGTRA